MASQTTQAWGLVIMSSSGKGEGTVDADRNVRDGRFAKAKQFLQVADDMRALAGDDGVADAAVTMYIHAGIAAADAICVAALGKHARGQDHQQAICLLATVDKKAASSLSALLGMKTRAGYGHDPVSADHLRRAERAARLLVDRASL